MLLSKDSTFSEISLLNSDRNAKEETPGCYPPLLRRFMEWLGLWKIVQDQESDNDGYGSIIEEII